MKFIRTIHDGYINLACVKELYVGKDDDGSCWVNARIVGEDDYWYSIKTFPADLDDPDTAAENWLDNFVAELNAGN